VFTDINMTKHKNVSIKYAPIIILNLMRSVTFLRCSGIFILKNALALSKK